MDYYWNKRNDDEEIAIFGFAEGTHVRKTQNIFWFFSHLIALWLRRRYSRSENPKYFLVFLSLNRTCASKNMQEDGKRL